MTLLSVSTWNHWPPGVNLRNEVDWNPCRIGTLLACSTPSTLPLPLAPASARIPRSAGVSHLCGRLISQPPPAINHVIWQRLQDGRRSSFHDPFHQRIYVFVIQGLTGFRSQKRKHNFPISPQDNSSLKASMHTYCAFVFAF